ncbi:hypothetical protein JVU11DRAFT_9900 [Chiua virens]|nr:hypothetical protein JVU11DRAFT_9900 [Chiua virens]
MGRSAGPSSLQILTHNLKGVVYVADFVPQRSSVAPVPALTISAGSQLEEIYAVAEANDVSVVLGTCLTVGAAGGFIQGGGVSSLTPTYGLAVDHLLEVEIVTADGVIRTINAVQDPDLFWAVRGGGAGSWGIVISITLAALPPTAVSTSSLVIEPDPAQDLRTLAVNFITLLGKYQNQITNAGVSTALGFNEGNYSLSFSWPARHASVALFYPLYDELRTLSSNYTVLSNFTQEFVYPSVATAIVEHFGPAADSVIAYGSSTELGSRYVPQSMLESLGSVQSIAEAIWEGLEIASAPLRDYPAGIPKPQVGLSIFGDVPAATRHRVNETGANPGAYDAAWHVLYTGTWTVGASRSAYQTLSRAVYDAVGPLTALGMMSSYQNEGSAWEVNWQEAFFGHKYDRLLQIKHKYDPTNFFTTYKGVGFAPNSAFYSCYEAYQKA